jgi:hypothetical protein
MLLEGDLMFMKMKMMKMKMKMVWQIVMQSVKGKRNASFSLGKVMNVS